MNLKADLVADPYHAQQPYACCADLGADEGLADLVVPFGLIALIAVVAMHAATVADLFAEV